MVMAQTVVAPLAGAWDTAAVDRKSRSCQKFPLRLICPCNAKLVTLPAFNPALRGGARPWKTTGFTVMELLVGVIGVVMALLLPAVARSKNRAQALYCLNNLRQIQTAWLFYTDDHQGWLPGVIGGSYPGGGRWVSGWMDFSNSPDNTNILHLVHPDYSQLAPYLASAAAYHCPSDRSTVLLAGRVHPRVRSVSMNCWMNYVGTESFGQDQFRVFRKLDDIQEPPPAKAWVVMDEREDSINDPLFRTNLKDRGVLARIVDFPASYHGRSAGIAFADGHAEIKRWVDQRTTPPLRARQLLQLDVPSPDNVDVAWLQARSSSRRPEVQ